MSPEPDGQRGFGGVAHRARGPHGDGTCEASERGIVVAARPGRGFKARRAQAEEAAEEGEEEETETEEGEEAQAAEALVQLVVVVVE